MNRKKGLRSYVKRNKAGGGNALFQAASQYRPAVCSLGLEAKAGCLAEGDVVGGGEEGQRALPTCIRASQTS